MIAPRAAKPTVRFIDEYCEAYRDLFAEVRSFEAFKHLHAGMLSDQRLNANLCQLSLKR